MDIARRLEDNSGAVADPRDESIASYRLQRLRMNSRPHPFLAVETIDEAVTFIDIRARLERAAKAEELDPEPAA